MHRVEKAKPSHVPSDVEQDTDQKTYNLFLFNHKSKPLETTQTQQYSKIFSEKLGHLQGTKVKICISPNSQRKFCKARSVSYYLKEEVEKELERLEAQNIISPVTFSEWPTPVVPVAKPDGNVRLCGDYKVTVNPVAKLDAYPLPKVDDLFAAVSGGKLFLKLDLAHAYPNSWN